MQLPELTLDTVRAILEGTLEDETVNYLVLHSLGFRYDEATQTWDPSAADPDWRGQPTPHFIAHRPDTVKLTRSIAAEDKQLLKEWLGFEGYKIHELTPQKTRRATAANWLLGVIKRQHKGS
jgi:hypothetical protein